MVIVKAPIVCETPKSDIASSMKCVVRTTTRPSRAERTMFQVDRRLYGSIPFRAFVVIEYRRVPGSVGLPSISIKDTCFFGFEFQG